MEDIAKRLSLSPKTVATHKYRSFDKLAVNDAIAPASVIPSSRIWPCLSSL